MSSKWHALYSCNCDRKLAIISQRKLAIISQQTFISGYSFDPDMPFGPLTR